MKPMKPLEPLLSGETRSEYLDRLERAEARPEIDADKIVAEFESIFGNLTATERRWLTRRIAGQEV